MKKLLLIFVLTIISKALYADTLWCTGKILNTYVSAGSGVFVKPDWGDWKLLCGLDGSRHSIGTETCQAWLSLAQVSIAADKRLTIKLENVSGECSTQANNGSFPKPVYVQLVK